ncbi:MAG: OprD family porin [Gammaproteobacteria bacterium]|nr:OprD family porin [Pseudomonas sp.]NLO52938.1 OprD family porin [Gammaproteobacteria bacterium]
MHIKINRMFVISSLAAAIAMPSLAQAAFVEDASGSLSLRNFYMNRDFRDNTSGQSKAEDWGQGFMLRLQSGYTEGTVGVGVDALGLAGVKLDSGGGTGGTGTLVRSRHSGKSADSHAFAGFTAKAKISETVLTLGTHEPLLPIAYRNDTRMLPQTFQGGQVQSKDIANLTLTAGQFQKVRLRDSTNYENMNMAADGATGGVSSNKFNYSGASYEFIPGLTGTYYFAELKDNYRQHHANLQFLTDLSNDLKFKSDLRYFNSSDQGQTTVDNRLASAMFSLGYQGHWLGLGYQDASGKTGTPYLAGGTDPWTMNTLTYQPFLRAKEDSWQVRYNYDFAQMGLPGLNLMARYASGDNFKVNNQSAKEWERDIDIGYTIQSGPLKDLGLLVRNVMYRGSHTTDVDENRIIANYTFKF